MILSSGVLWEGTPAEYTGFPGGYGSGGYSNSGGVPLTPGLSWPGGVYSERWASYAEIYRRQVWVAAVVNKLAMGEARLPLKVYEHDDQNRPEVAPAHPYAQLLRRPNRHQSRFSFWLWTVSTFDVHGEAFWGKIRDPGGRPVELVPLHPTGMHLDRDVAGEQEPRWSYQNGRVRIEGIPRSDLVHFHTFNPDTWARGMSRLEPLRRTLEFEDAAQRAQSSYWAKGARPGVLLHTDRTLSQAAVDKLKIQWDAVAGGADNIGRTVVLEEGVKPERWALTAEENQYIESRKLNREEVCAVFDVPPPAVHILDRATFSNITEQLRSLYRDTHAPRLQLFESTLEHDLRASRRPGATDPDFSDDVYAEFLLDEVLRGDFEVRATAYQAADWMTVAEKRQRENLPFIAGTDTIMVNAATIPLEVAQEGLDGPDTPEAGPGDPQVASVAGLAESPMGEVTALATAIQKIYLGVGPVITADEARGILNRAGAGLVGSLPISTRGAGDLAANLRVLMGRLGRVKTLADVDADALVEGTAGAEGAVRAALSASLAAGHSVSQFRELLQTISTGGHP